MRSPEDPGPDNSIANLTIFLAIFLMITVAISAGMDIGLVIGAVCLSIIGAGLKISKAISHAARRSTHRESGV